MTGKKTKGTLNYKTPGFWVVVIGIIVIVVAGTGLLSNPRDKETNIPEESEVLTVEDYAKNFIEQNIEMYEDVDGPWQGFKIIDSKVTRLEIIETFDNILESPIEIWALEYRLKPDDISKVAMAGGMQEDDGWLTEDTSMGKPFLAFSIENGIRNFLGSFYPQEFGFDTLAKQEISLRIMLERQGLLPKEEVVEISDIDSRNRTTSVKREDMGEFVPIEKVEDQNVSAESELFKITITDYTLGQLKPEDEYRPYFEDLGINNLDKVTTLDINLMLENLSDDTITIDYLQGRLITNTGEELPVILEVLGENDKLKFSGKEVKIGSISSILSSNTEDIKNFKLIFQEFTTLECSFE